MKLPSCSPACARASGCSAQPRASGRNIFSPAVTPLLLLRCPAARAQAGAFCPERSCSLSVEVKRAVPLLQNETQNMNTTENLIATGSLTIAPQPENKIVKPLRFPPQPQEWKIVSLRECPTPDTMQQCETPDQAAAYWRAHIANHPYFKELVSYCTLLLFSQTGRIPESPALSAFDFSDYVFCRSFVKPLIEIVDTDALDQTQVAPVVN